MHHLAQPIGQLSGGEIVKAMLFLLLYQENALPLLILDDSSNHLNLEGVLASESFLECYQGAILFVSHDEGCVQSIQPNCFLHKESGVWEIAM